jgi:DNA-binding beta-propeller fold protein YncE
VTWYRPSTKSSKPVAAVGFLRFPRAIAIESDGQILVTDPGAFEGSLIRIDPRTGQQSAFSRGGFLTNANHPFGVTVETNGNILVATTNAGGIVRINPLSGQQSVVVPARGLLKSPRGIALDQQGMIYVADEGQVVRVDPRNGSATPIAAGNRLETLMGIVLTSKGVFVTDGNAKGVIRIDPATAEQEFVAETGRFGSPYGLAVTEGGDLLVVDEGGTVYQIDSKTKMRTPLLSEGLRGPIAVAVVGPVRR